MDKLFVYGTLRRSKSMKFICNGVFQGKMYDVGAFPAVIESNDPDDVVVGEVYEVDDDTLSVLDMYEGVPRLYIRKEVTIKTQDGEELKCFIYIFNQSVGEMRTIETGDWLKQTKKEISR